MSTIKQWYSASELADMKLAGMPNTKKGMLDKAERESWPRQKRAGRGGGYEFQPSKAVMDLVREYVLQHMTKSTPAELPAVAPKSELPCTINAPIELKDWQRSTAEARAAICAEVRRLAAVGGTERAVRTVIDLAEKGELQPHLQQLVSVANARAGREGKRTLSRSSLFRWLKDAEGGVAALAPRQRASNDIPAWAPFLLGLYRQPQKPSLAYCIERLPAVLPPGVSMPSYHAALRFLKKISKTEVQRGRMGNREIKSIRPFVRRDTSQMWPADAYTADGHTFDAEVAHPMHGRAFRPEITTVLDIATRRAVGWSAGLAESTWAVLDALRHACLTGGIPAIFYVDNGSGYKSAAMSAEATGFLARIGATLTHSLPSNSQARGIEERSHKTIWVRGAKTLSTYMGADMDREAKQKAFKITRADLRLVGSSRHLMPWNDFLLWWPRRRRAMTTSWPSCRR
jgi:putative transposase